MAGFSWRCPLSPSSPPTDLLPTVARQIDVLRLDPSRPLLISDCDEVILKFMEGLERFLATQGCRIDLDSFRLHGNIKDAATGAVVPNDRVSALLVAFYEQAHHDLGPVAGVAGALHRLSTRLQIIVLTNVAEEAKASREANLAKIGAPYPVIANHGLKGAAAAALAARAGRPVFFIDDIPHNIISVKDHVPECQCIHFVADPRLDRLLETAPGATARARGWRDIEAVVAAALDRTDGH